MADQDVTDTTTGTSRTQSAADIPHLNEGRNEAGTQQAPPNDVPGVQPNDDFARNQNYSDISQGNAGGAGTSGSDVGEDTRGNPTGIATGGGSAGANSSSPTTGTLGSSTSAGGDTPLTRRDENK